MYFARGSVFSPLVLGSFVEIQKMSREKDVKGIRQSLLLAIIDLPKMFS